MPIDLEKYRKATTTNSVMPQPTTPQRAPINLEKYKKKNTSVMPTAPKQGIDNWASDIPVLKQVQDVGIGIGSALGRTGLGLGEAVLKTGMWAGNQMNKIAPGSVDNSLAQRTLETIQKGKENIYTKPFESNLETGAGQTGTFVGNAAPYFAGGAPVQASRLGFATLLPRAVAAVPYAAQDAAIAAGQSGGDVKSTLATGATSLIANTILPGSGAPIAQKIATGTASGYVSDVGMGLAGQRGEDRTGSNAFKPGWGTVAGAGFGTLSAIPQIKQSVNNLNGKPVSPDTLAGTITQGSIHDRRAAERALQTIDPTNIKTYSDLQKALDTKIKELVAIQDTHTGTASISKNLSELNLSTKVGDRTVQHNYVLDALNQLDEHYAKINDPVSQAKIEALYNKAITEGLNTTEVNSIARIHGQEINAFNANGEAASGLTKQAAENTRTGVKQTAAQMSGDPVKFKGNDAAITDAIRTRDLVKKVNEGVNKLQQKIIQRGWIETGGRKVIRALDILSGHFLKGAVEALIPRGQGFKTMNALDLQEKLQQNLIALQKALDNPNTTQADVMKIIDNQSRIASATMPQNIKNNQTPTGTRTANFTSNNNTRKITAIPNSARNAETMPFDNPRSGNFLSSSSILPTQKTSTNIEAPRSTINTGASSGEKSVMPTVIPPKRPLASALPTAPKNTAQQGQLFAGGIAGFEMDEEGHVTFNPEKALLGMAAMAGYQKLPKAELLKRIRTSIPNQTKTEMADFVTTIKSGAVKTDKDGFLQFATKADERAFEAGMAIVTERPLLRDRLANSTLAKIANLYDEVLDYNKNMQPGLSIKKVADTAEDQLMREARKYKSADEFVKGQGEIVYRGTNNKTDAPFIENGKIYVTPDKDFTKYYGTNLHEYVISPNAKILDSSVGEGKKLFDEYLKETGNTFYSSGTKNKGRQPFWTAQREYVDWLEKKGVKYDGMWFAESDRTPSLAINKKEMLIPRSQLTDIYNRAHKK